MCLEIFRGAATCWHSLQSASVAAHLDSCGLHAPIAPKPIKFYNLLVIADLDLVAASTSLLAGMRSTSRTSTSTTQPSLLRRDQVLLSARHRTRSRKYPSPHMRPNTALLVSASFQPLDSCGCSDAKSLRLDTSKGLVPGPQDCSTAAQLPA